MDDLLALIFGALCDERAALQDAPGRRGRTPPAGSPRTGGDNEPVSTDAMPHTPAPIGESTSPVPRQADPLADATGPAGAVVDDRGPVRRADSETAALDPPQRAPRH